MSLLTRLDSWFWAPERREEHVIDKMALWGTGDDIGEPVHAGVNVSQDSALRFSVVWRCIDLISGTLAGLPAEAVRKRGDIREPVDRAPAWLQAPNPESNWYEFAERIFESLLMDGNAFLVITGRDAQGFPAEIWTLNPQRVQVRRRERSREIFFLVDGSTEYTRYTNATAQGLMGDVLHLRLKTAGGLRGMSPIEAARQSIGLGLVTEKFGARYFGNGDHPSSVLEFESSAQGVTQKNIDLTKANWKRKHAGSDRSHEPGILVGAKWRPMSINPEESQFLQTRAFQVEDIASRIYGVPPHLVGLQGYTSHFGTGIEQQGIGLYRFTLKGHLTRFETAMSTLLPRGQFLRLNPRALLEGDAKTETEVLETAVQNGVINRNEWRAKWDLPPIPGGDRYILPLNFQILTPGGVTEPTPEPAPSPNGKVAAEVTP